MTQFQMGCEAFGCAEQAMRARRPIIDGSRRPADDWRFPDDPWLLDLRRRVIERFGPDYGAPPQ